MEAKKTGVWIATAAAIAVVIAIVIVLIAPSPKVDEAKVVLTAEVAEHPELTVSVDEKETNSLLLRERARSGSENEEEWNNLLAEEGSSTEKRTHEMAEDIARKKVLEKLASENGVAVSDDDVSAYIDELCSDLMVSRSDLLLYAPNAEDCSSLSEYAERVKSDLVVQRLHDFYYGNISIEDLDDEDIMAWVDEYDVSYDGTPYAMCIALNKNNPDALSVLELAQKDFESVRSTYSVISGFDGALGVTNTLDDPVIWDTATQLSMGQVSGIINGDEYDFIVKNTGSYTSPEAGYSNISDIPEPMQTFYRKTAANEIVNGSYCGRYINPILDGITFSD